MKVEVTKQMIHQAFLNADKKLSTKQQKENVYSPKAERSQYYINNVIGELGELSFAKAVKELGYELGVDPDLFGTFMNSDVCDFYGSKTAHTIDVKTVYKENADNLIINRQISNWRKIDSYVLIKLHSETEVTDPMSIYKIYEAQILGSMSFRTINRYRNLRNMYGKQVFFIEKDRLSNIKRLIDNHFDRQGEHKQTYTSTGTLRLDIASIENGALEASKDNGGINQIAREKREDDKGEGHYNFIPANLGFYKLVSFSLHRGKFHTSLFLKALLTAEARCRRHKKTLIIPNYIENYIPERDLDKISDVIANLKCNVQCNWVSVREVTKEIQL